jgi:glutathione S-transferase
LNLQNPLFVAYLIAASIMILKLMGQGWMTVYRMIRADAGLLNPEDLKPGPANRNPRPEQLELNEDVDRSRRTHGTDPESIPAFLVCGLLYVAIEPPAVLAGILFFLFVAARLAHTAAYLTGQRHEVRATFFSIGSIVVVIMALHILLAAIARI